MTVKHVLIVEDSATDRAFLGEILTRNGYTVSNAESAEDAIEKSKQLKPDVILMDIVMPGQNGFQATRSLSRDEETKHIPIIICSSKGLETDRIWGLRQGAKEYLVKPIDQAELLRKIAELG
jgi:twitching motility two-component system response regulator PilH